jgi:hypothetical protein
MVSMEQNDTATFIKIAQGDFDALSTVMAEARTAVVLRRNAEALAPDLTTLDKLKIVRQLLRRSGNQSNTRTCLWSVVRHDERLRAAGLNDSTDAYEFFGVPVTKLFGPAPKLVKHFWLCRWIAKASRQQSHC